MSDIRLIGGEALATLKMLPAESVQTCVTSPPYWGLRSYGVEPDVWGGADDCDHEWGNEIAVNATNHTDKRRWNHTRNGRDEEQPTAKRVAWLRTVVPQGQFCQSCGAWFGCLGLEPTPQLYVANVVAIFEEVRRVLRDDGTLWLNLGDSYATGAGKACSPGGGKQGEQFQGPTGYLGAHDLSQKQSNGATLPTFQPNRMPIPGLKPKDLVGIPWRVAFALQEAGWYLRSDIIWSKPNPMPESVTDRPTKAHEYLFLLSKSQRYYYDQDAILEPVSDATHAHVQNQIGSARANGGAKTNGNMKAVGRKLAPAGEGIKNNESMDAALAIMPESRNKRTVWTVPTKSYKGAHFATFPPKLIEPCILAGAPEGGIVLDPFAGSGTTLAVAILHGRQALGIELNPAYIDLANERIADARKERAAQLESLTMPLFDEPAHLPAKLFAD